MKDSYEVPKEVVTFYSVKWRTKKAGMHYVVDHENIYFDWEKDLAADFKKKVGGYLQTLKTTITSRLFTTLSIKANNRTKRKPSRRWNDDVATGVKDTEEKIRKGIPFTRKERRRMNKKGIDHKGLRQGFFYED